MKIKKTFIVLVSQSSKLAGHKWQKLYKTKSGHFFLEYPEGGLRRITEQNALELVKYTINNIQ